MKKKYLININYSLFLNGNNEFCCIRDYLNEETRALYEEKKSTIYPTGANYLKDVTRYNELLEEQSKIIKQCHIPLNYLFVESKIDTQREDTVYIEEIFEGKLYEVDKFFLNICEISTIKANWILKHYKSEDIKNMLDLFQNLDFKKTTKGKILKFPNVL